MSPRSTPLLEGRRPKASLVVRGLGREGECLGLGLVGSRFLVGFFVQAQLMLELVLELLGNGGVEFD